MIAATTLEHCFSRLCTVARAEPGWPAGMPACFCDPDFLRYRGAGLPIAPGLHKVSDDPELGPLGWAKLAPF